MIAFSRSTFPMADGSRPGADPLHMRLVAQELSRIPADISVNFQLEILHFVIFTAIRVHGRSGVVLHLCGAELRATELDWDWPMARSL